MFHRSRRALAAAAVTLAAGLVLTACGGTTNEDGQSKTNEESSFNLDDVKVDDAAAAMLPADLKSKGTLTVGTDTTYPPNEYIDSDGKTIIGMDIDLIKAIGAKLGVEMEPQTAAFESIIPSIGSTYDLAISSFTINDERMQVVDFVSYYNAGTLWAAAEGSDITPDTACGKSVAVQVGTVQEEELPGRSDKCVADGEDPIDIQPYDSQGDATTAVVTGKADAMLADLPVVIDAIRSNDGKLVEVGEMYDAAPYGIALPKGNTAFADAVLAALKSLQEDGTYDEILKKWSAEEGALDDPQINPQGA